MLVRFNQRFSRSLSHFKYFSTKNTTQSKIIQNTSTLGSPHDKLLKHLSNPIPNLNKILIARKLHDLRSLMATVEVLNHLNYIGINGQKIFDIYLNISKDLTEVNKLLDSLYITNANSINFLNIYGIMDEKLLSLVKNGNRQNKEFNTESDIPPYDLIISLGGDGTLLRAIYSTGNTVFRNELPMVAPVVAFALGSLSFLTPHSFQTRSDALGYQHVLNSILMPTDENHIKICSPNGSNFTLTDEHDINVLIRSRLRCEIWKKDGGVSETPIDMTPVKDTSLSRVHRVFNECLVSRGAHGGFLRLSTYVNGNFLTEFQADGLIVATPSGSSAYSMAAGGSLVAPSVSAILLTPIAPHSLTCRPIVLPADVTIDLVPSIENYMGREVATPFVSFDGRDGQSLENGAFVRIKPSRSPVPFCVVGKDVLVEWLESLRSKLHWAKELR